MKTTQLIKYKNQYLFYPNSHPLLELREAIPFEQAFNYNHSYLTCPLCNEWFNVKIPTKHIHSHSLYKKDWPYLLDVYDPIARHLDFLYFNNHDSYLIQTKTKHYPYYIPEGYTHKSVEKGDQKLYLWQLKAASMGKRTVSPIFTKSHGSRVGIIDIDIYSSEILRILTEIYSEARKISNIKNMHCNLSGRKGGDLLFVSDINIPLQTWTDFLNNFVDRLPKSDEVTYEIMPSAKSLCSSKKPAMMKHQETQCASAFINHDGSLIKNQQIYFLTLKSNDSSLFRYPTWKKPIIILSQQEEKSYEEENITDDEALKRLRDIIIEDEETMEHGSRGAWEQGSNSVSSPAHLHTRSFTHQPSVVSSGATLYQNELIQIEEYGLVEPGTRNYWLWRIAVLHRDVEHLSRTNSIKRLNHWSEEHMNGFSKSTLRERLNEVKYLVNYIYDNPERYRNKSHIGLRKLTHEDLQFIKSFKLKEEDAEKLLAFLIQWKRSHGWIFMKDRFYVAEREMRKALGGIGWYKLKRLLRYLTKIGLIFRTFKGRSSKYKNRRLSAEYILFYNTKIEIQDSNPVKASPFPSMCPDEDKQLCGIMMKLSKGNWLYRIEHPNAIENKHFEWKIRSFKFFNLGKIPRVETLIGSSLLRHIDIDENAFNLLLEVA